MTRYPRPTPPRAPGLGHAWPLVLLVWACLAGAVGAAQAADPTPTPAACDDETCSPANATATPYHFTLRNESLPQDLVVQGADAVDARDVRVFRDLAISDSHNVTLQRVTIAGNATFDHIDGGALTDLTVVGRLTLSHVSNLTLARARVGGDITCEPCNDTVLRDVTVGGAIRMLGTNLTRVNVLTSPLATSLPAAPTPQPGQVQLRLDNETLAFVHDRQVEEAAGRIDVRLDVDPDAATARLRAQNRTGPGLSATDLDSRFEKVIEFEDRNGDGAFDLGDHVLRETRIADLDPRAVHQERVVLPVPAWRGRIEYDVAPGGLLALIFTTADGATNETKIDLEVHDYPYASPTSRLALQVRLMSPNPWRLDEANGTTRLVFTGQDFEGYFDWTPHALVDGKSRPVRSHIVQEPASVTGASDVVVLLSYERGAHVVHDPTLGLVATATPLAILIVPLGDWQVYTATFAGGLLLMWALARLGGRAKP